MLVKEMQMKVPPCVIVEGKLLMNMRGFNGRGTALRTSNPQCRKVHGVFEGVSGAYS